MVTRDEHRDRQVGRGERRGSDLVACRANWPWSFLIRSIYRARRVFRPLVLPFSLARPRFSFPSFHSSDAMLLEMKCRGFINLYLPPIAFCTGVDSQLYNPGTTGRRAAMCVFVHSCFCFNSPILFLYPFS